MLCANIFDNIFMCCLSSAVPLFSIVLFLFFVVRCKSAVPLLLYYDKNAALVLSSFICYSYATHTSLFSIEC